MSRPVHVSEPRWGDDPDFEEERFEERQAKDIATMALVGCFLVIVVLFLTIWWWLVSTVTPGRVQAQREFIEEARR